MKKITRIDPLSLGKILAGLYALLGIIFGLFFFAISLVGALFSEDSGSGLAVLGVAIFFIIIVPILYAVMGLIGGIITAWLFNLIAKYTGGVELDIEEAKKK